MTTTMMSEFDMREHITQSNLIESVTDPREIEQSLVAWQWLIKQSMPFTGEMILHLHGLIMKNLLPARTGGAGSYRVNNVTVGGRMCPHWREIQERMDDWLTHMLNWFTLDPIHEHVRFEHIHPFVDGNGRTGRMLMWKHQIEANYVPSLIMYEKRWDYYTWF